jgi:hypothetical protein
MPKWLMFKFVMWVQRNPLITFEPIGGFGWNFVWRWWHWRWRGSLQNGGHLNCWGGCNFWTDFLDLDEILYGYVK